MGMFSVGPGPSDLVVEVDVVADDVVASVDVVADVDFDDSVSVVDDVVVCVSLLLMVSILSTTISTRTFTGISCICTLFTVSVSSSSMVLMNSYCSGLLSFVLVSGIDLDSVAADPSVVDVCSAAGSVVVVAHLNPLVAALSAAVFVSAQALWQLVVDG